MVPGKKHGWFIGREGQTLGALWWKYKQWSLANRKNLNLAGTSRSMCQPTGNLRGREKLLIDTMGKWSGKIRLCETLQAKKPAFKKPIAKKKKKLYTM